MIEDTPATYQDMGSFSVKAFAELVEGCQNLIAWFRDKKGAQAENFRKMIMAMVQDIRVILIKLLLTAPITCARWAHCARTSVAASPAKRWKSTVLWRTVWYHIKTELEGWALSAVS